MKRVFAVAVLLLVSVAQSGYAQCSAADKAALEALDRAWGEASLRGDGAYLENIYAAGFMGHNPAGTVDRATTIANALRGAAAATASPQPGPVVGPDHFMISCSGNTATISHRNTQAPAAGSTNAPTYSRSVHFMEKRGNSWKAVSSTGHGLADGAVLAYMERDWNDAASKRDVAWYERNYASNATDVSSRTGAIESKLQSIESMKSDKTVYESLELSDLNTRVDGNMAVVTGVNHVKGRDGDGKPFDRRVRFTDTFVKRDGRWVVWATQGTNIQ